MPMSNDHHHSASEAVALRHERETTWLTLERPDKLNAFNEEIVEGLIAGVEEASRNRSRLLIIKGSGRAFSAGFDLSGLRDQTDGDLALRFVRIELLLQSILGASMSTLAFVHGRCFGAAADLFSVCDRRVASPDATFRFPGLHFGVVLGTRRLARLVGSDHAKSILETTRVIDAAEAQSMGLVNMVLPEGEWDSEAERAHRDASTLPRNVQAEMLYRMRTRPKDEDLAALVRSVAEPGLKSRVSTYLESLRK